VKRLKEGSSKKWMPKAQYKLHINIFIIHRVAQQFKSLFLKIFFLLAVTDILSLPQESQEASQLSKSIIDMCGVSR